MKEKQCGEVGNVGRGREEAYTSGEKGRATGVRGRDRDEGWGE